MEYLDSGINQELDKILDEVSDTFDKRLPTINCNHCQYSTKIKGHMKQHINSVHRKIRFTCSECGKSFSQKSSLNLHIRGIHIGIRNAGCYKCDRSFAQKSSLKYHIESVHEGKRHKSEKKKIKCSNCDSFYSNQYLMEKHCRFCIIKKF